MKSNEERIFLEPRIIIFVLIFIAALLAFISGILNAKVLGIALILILILSLFASPLIVIARKA